MSQTWYCRLEGREIGPLTSEQLKAMAVAGQLNQSDLVRRTQSDAWIPAMQVSGLMFQVGKWYVQTPDGQTFGPVPKSELDGWVSEKRLTAECHILEEGSEQWQSITSLYPVLVHPGLHAADNASSFDFEAVNSSATQRRPQGITVTQRNNRKRSSPVWPWMIGGGVGATVIMAGILLAITSQPSAAPTAASQNIQDFQPQSGSMPQQTVHGGASQTGRRVNPAKGQQGIVYQKGDPGNGIMPGPKVVDTAKVEKIVLGNWMIGMRLEGGGVSNVVMKIKPHGVCDSLDLGNEDRWRGQWSLKKDDPTGRIVFHVKHEDQYLTGTLAELTDDRFLLVDSRNRIAHFNRIKEKLTEEDGWNPDIDAFLRED